MPSRPWSRPISCCDPCWTGSPTRTSSSEAQFADVMKQHRFHDAIRDRLVGLPQVGVASIFNKEGHLLSSSSDWPAPSVHIGERETFLAQVGPNSPPVSISRALPDVEQQALDASICRAGSSPRPTSCWASPSSASNPTTFSNLFRLISLGEDSSVSLFRIDGALLATHVERAGPDGQDLRRCPADPQRSATASPAPAQITRSRNGGEPLGIGSAHRLVAPGRRLSGARHRDDRRQDLLGQWRERLYFILTLALLLSAVAGSRHRPDPAAERAHRSGGAPGHGAPAAGGPDRHAGGAVRGARPARAGDLLQRPLSPSWSLAATSPATSCATRPCTAPPPSSPSPPATTRAASRSISRSSGPATPRTTCISRCRIDRCPRSATARS